MHLHLPNWFECPVMKFPRKYALSATRKALPINHIQRYGLTQFIYAQNTRKPLICFSHSTVNAIKDSDCSFDNWKLSDQIDVC